MNERKELMRQIKDEVLALKNSPLYKFRIENTICYREGSHFAKIMFIMKPRVEMKLKQETICGAAGKILDELLESAHIKEKKFISQTSLKIVPSNRDLLPEEIKVYGPFLDRQSILFNQKSSPL